MGLMMFNHKKLMRGSVWFVDLDPVVGHEQAKRRPCIIMSADSYNQGAAGLVVILPITSRHRDLYWHVPLTQTEGGLERPSYVMCDQLRNLSVQRFSSGMVGMVSDYTMGQIEERLKILLYLVLD